MPGILVPGPQHGLISFEEANMKHSQLSSANSLNFSCSFFFFGHAAKNARDLFTVRIQGCRFTKGGHKVNWFAKSNLTCSSQSPHTTLNTPCS